jgi:hypothetical protein
LVNGRSLAASIATMPADGSFETGTAHLTQIAQWLIDHVDASRVPPAEVPVIRVGQSRPSARFCIGSVNRLLRARGCS